ncbi:IPExxxVDY family protein [Cochleicola gelatinilyticus]|uniref:IPExxxVDY family protein n=1 Tax=Cochleicola gelatinilyticus TaxID=1763537 RepID=A0A167J4C9_9FLAO|nr:IPExxxVDY family protein [Cochleicola gelatinilyticus]OAB80322.1 hypothetical protein ULVI_06185 [Cochleicola gelatinilyticus]
MANHRLVLDDDFSEEFTLIAIHCSEEAYKMAYLLNQNTGLKLYRREVDLDFSNNGLEVTFPLFEFEDEYQYTTYNLIANKCRSIAAHINSSGGLFDASGSESLVTTYLVPEYKNVDFFLKVYSDFETIPLRKILAAINQIKQVISSYNVDTEIIKSKNNLIFD